MELEELKANWLQLSRDMQAQQEISRKITVELARQKFKNNFYTIALPEMAGSILCLAAALYVGVNFSALINFQLRAFGLASILLLVLIPILSYISIQKLKPGNASKNTYLQTIKTFCGRQLSFIKLQGIIRGMSIVLAIVYIPAFTMISTNRDISATLMYWQIILPVCAVVFFIISKKVGEHYKRTVQKMAQLLEV